MNDSATKRTGAKKAAFIFDGDCHFCRYWIRRWQAVTDSSVVFLAAQDETVRRDFAQLSPAQLAEAVHLIEPDGAIYRGSEAVFRLWAFHGTRSWPFRISQRFPAIQAVSERIYQFVARHRTALSGLTRTFWGLESGPSDYRLITRIFLRLLALIYLIAFVSLWVQAEGLFGSAGIAPISQNIQMAASQLPTAGALARFTQYPTLFWWFSTDRFLQIACLTGAGAAVALFFNLLPLPTAVLLWLLYLSFTTAGSEFLSFQWDTLLLETGFLAILLAPLRGKFLILRRPNLGVVWLFRWLLFRLMLQSGCVKLLSGDRTWRDLTALQFHYETQPLPTWIGYFVHQAPARVHTVSAGAMFAVELVLPFLIFMPRRPRLLAAFAFLALQAGIFLTGNYCFFNLLTMALCLFLFDDAALVALIPRRRGAGQKVVQNDPTLERTGRTARRWVCAALAIPILLISGIDLAGMFRWIERLPEPLTELYRRAAPFRSVNSYGLFAIMTTRRNELVVEGSDDGEHWNAYEFKYKPGDLSRRPRFVAPHQPRLDWQMWFAALSNYRQNPWLVEFCLQLLRGSAPVAGLLEKNPFPRRPPRYVRVQSYEYHFTDWKTLRETGTWWQRSGPQPYLPAIALRERGEANPR